MIDPHTFDELQANAGADFVAELVDCLMASGNLDSKPVREEIPMATKNSVTVQFSKISGAPQAVLYVGETSTLAELQGALAGLYKDKTALKAVGLRFCGGCKSGLDLLIRPRFETQIDVPGF